VLVLADGGFATSAFLARFRAVCRDDSICHVSSLGRWGSADN
jgi:hypothetical protein